MCFFPLHILALVGSEEMLTGRKLGIQKMVNGWKLGAQKWLPEESLIIISNISLNPLQLPVLSFYFPFGYNFLAPSFLLVTTFEVKVSFMLPFFCYPLLLEFTEKCIFLFFFVLTNMLYMP